jgi:predicted GIY-YIG superfamily endonuclease
MLRDDDVDKRWGLKVMQPAVYIVANRRNGALYTGVTSNLPQRVWQHREGVADGFTKQFGCKKLVWFDMAETIEIAILREKQIKGGSRAKKLALVAGLNPDWRDLFSDIAQR